MIRDLIVKFLREEGYVPNVDERGNVTFKADGRFFVYFYDQNDEEFFQLGMPSMADVTPENREMMLEICNEMNYGIKVVKTMIIGQSVWGVFEGIFDSTPEFGEIIPRAIKMLIDNQQSFFEKID